MAKIHEICKGNLWGASFETASIRSTVRLFCSIFKRRQVASTSRSVCLSVGRSVCPQNEIQKATNNICTQKLHIIKPSLRRGLSRLFFFNSVFGRDMSLFYSILYNAFNQSQPNTETCQPKTVIC